MAAVAYGAVRIEGLDQLRRAIKVLAPEATKELRKELKGLAEVVATDAQGRVPVRTGAARAAIRPSTSGSNAQVRASLNQVPYYGWLDFGGTLKPTGGRHNTIERKFLGGGRYLFPAFYARRAELVNRAPAALRRAIRSAGLG